MKFLALALTLVVLPACRTQSSDGGGKERAPIAPAGAVPAIDLSAHLDRSMTVEEFVKVCQELGGFNFTYAESTRAGLNATSLRFEGPDRVPVTEFEDFMVAQLQKCGFTCEPVGPEHLHVFLVKSRTL